MGCSSLELNAESYLLDFDSVKEIETMRLIRSDSHVETRLTDESPSNRNVYVQGLVHQISGRSVIKE